MNIKDLENKLDILNIQMQSLQHRLKALGGEFDSTQRQLYRARLKEEQSEHSV
jgi:chaperonin cofactor prefoldin